MAGKSIGSWVRQMHLCLNWLAQTRHMTLGKSLCLSELQPVNLDRGIILVPTSKDSSED